MEGYHVSFDTIRPMRPARGDRVYLFRFSRGAYTARAVAAMHNSLKGSWWIAELLPKGYKGPRRNFRTQ